MSGLPGYWMHEQSGVLAPVVRKYLEHGELDGFEIRIMRAYLRQWVNALVWNGDGRLALLRAQVESIETTGDVRRWLDAALDLGIDPL